MSLLNWEIYQSGQLSRVVDTELIILIAHLILAPGSIPGVGWVRRNQTNNKLVLIIQIPKVEFVIDINFIGDLLCIVNAKFILYSLYIILNMKLQCEKTLRKIVFVLSDLQGFFRYKRRIFFRSIFYMKCRIKKQGGCVGKGIFLHEMWFCLGGHKVHSTKRQFPRINRSQGIMLYSWKREM